MIRIVNNLLINTTKFTQENGNVELIREPGLKDMICLSVTDFGVGILKDEFSKLFAKYFEALRL